MCLGMLINHSAYVQPQAKRWVRCTRSNKWISLSKRIANPQLMIAPEKSAHSAAKTYILPAIPATTQWGSYNSSQQPVLTIKNQETAFLLRLWQLRTIRLFQGFP